MGEARGSRKSPAMRVGACARAETVRCMGSHVVCSSTISISVAPWSESTCDDARTSPPAARESMSIARRDVVMLGSYLRGWARRMERTRRRRTLRISSRSSLNASATDAIQNLLKRSFKTCSSCFCCSVDVFPVGKGGIEVGGGVGERGRRASVSGATFGESSLVGSASEAGSESESDDDDEEEDSSADSCIC